MYHLPFKDEEIETQRIYISCPSHSELGLEPQQTGSRAHGLNQNKYISLIRLGENQRSFFLFFSLSCHSRIYSHHPSEYKSPAGISDSWDPEREELLTRMRDLEVRKRENLAVQAGPSKDGKATETQQRVVS